MFQVWDTNGYCIIRWKGEILSRLYITKLLYIFNNSKQKSVVRNQWYELKL
jgi:hypothetical protein